MELKFWSKNFLRLACLAAAMVSGSARAGQCYEFHEFVADLRPLFVHSITITILRTYNDDLVDEISVQEVFGHEIHESLGCVNSDSRPVVRTCTIGDDSGQFQIERIPVDNGQAQTLVLEVQGHINTIPVANDSDTKIAVIPSGNFNSLQLARILPDAECRAKFPESKPIPVIPSPAFVPSPAPSLGKP